MNNYGTILIKVNEVLERSGLSKNELCYKAQVQRLQLNSYCNKTVTRLDLHVLSRLCYALDCKLTDLIEYVPEDTDMTSTK